MGKKTAVADALSDALYAEIRDLVKTAKKRSKVEKNADVSPLYWQVGRRINTELLKGERADYGKHVITALSRRLTKQFGKGWSPQQLWHCSRFAEAFPQQETVSTVWNQLSWSHLKLLIYIDDLPKRNFYMERAMEEKWSVRAFSERVDNGLFEQKTLQSEQAEVSQESSLEALPIPETAPEEATTEEVQPEEAVDASLEEALHEQIVEAETQKETRESEPPAAEELAHRPVLLTEPDVLDYLNIREKVLRQEIEDAVLLELYQLLLELYDLGIKSAGCFTHKTPETVLQARFQEVFRVALRRDASSRLTEPLP